MINLTTFNNPSPDPIPSDTTMPALAVIDGELAGVIVAPPDPNVPKIFAEGFVLAMSTIMTTVVDVVEGKTLAEGVAELERITKECQSMPPDLTAGMDGLFAGWKHACDQVTNAIAKYRDNPNHVVSDDS